MYKCIDYKRMSCENCELMKHEFDSLYGILRKERNNFKDKVRSMQFHVLITNLLLDKYIKENGRDINEDFEKGKVMITFELMVLKKFKDFFRHLYNLTNE